MHDRHNDEVMEALFLTAGMGLSIDRLCGFYSNGAIIAALVGGFACAVVVAPPDAVLESRDLSEGG